MTWTSMVQSTYVMVKKIQQLQGIFRLFFDVTAIPTCINLFCTFYYFAFPCNILSFYTLSYFILFYLVLSYLISSTPHLSLS